MRDTTPTNNKRKADPDYHSRSAKLLHFHIDFLPHNCYNVGNKLYAQRRCRITGDDPKFRSGVTSTFADVAY
jgi:hypothetical protein